MIRKIVRLLCSVLTFLACLLPTGMAVQVETGKQRAADFYVMGMDSMLQQETQRVWEAAMDRAERGFAAAVSAPVRALQVVLSGETFGRFLQNHSPPLRASQRDMQLLSRMSGVVLRMDHNAIETVLRMRNACGSG